MNNMTLLVAPVPVKEEFHLDVQRWGEIMLKKLINISLIAGIVTLILTYSILATKVSEECEDEGGMWITKVESGINNTKQMCIKK
ncbi:hypothetical protein [Paenibacillus sp. M2]|uniref:hypothetical protein n=1 Tax=Paenibacillus sp. M2 TaxID=3341793 RepID=UPI003989455E